MIFLNVHRNYFQFLTESNQLILALCRDAGIVGNKNAMLGRQSLDADRINAEIVEIRGKMAKIGKKKLKINFKMTKNHKKINLKNLN